jgi:hypothetical protein
MFAPTKRFSVTSGHLVTKNRSQGNEIRASAGRKKETANVMPFLTDAAGGRNSLSMTRTGPLAFNYMLTGLVPEHEELLRRYYRDIYLYDQVAGSAVDMISQFPFSAYTLTGADKEQLEKFNESLFRLNLRSLMPEISSSYLVDGMFIGTLVFNHQDKVFIDILLHNPDDAKIEPSPFYSNDPQITIVNNATTKKFMASNEKWAVQIRKMFSQQFLQALSHTAYELNPMTTLYIPRRTLPSRPATSFLKRILPIYLLEKQLYRGTLVEAHKRQRSMLHVTAGDDNWEPTPEELDALVAVFQQAELDPLGAVISTRTSVQAQEMRQGGDFWKWTDQADVLVPYKLRALGISEAFLSADANFSNSETALSVFLENMDAYRSFLTYKVFENKIFPIVAVANNFWKKGAKRPEHKTLDNMAYDAKGQHDLILPKVSWHKSLEARRDDNPMDLLTTLSEKGLPIPLRMWASAAKIDLDTLLYELNDDAQYRAKIEAYSQKMEEHGINDGIADEGDDESPEGEERAKVLAATRLPFSQFARRKIPLLSRDFGNLSEISGVGKTGKKKWIFDRKAANERANMFIAQAVKSLSDPERRKQVKDQVVSKLGRVPNLLGAM